MAFFLPAEARVPTTSVVSRREEERSPMTHRRAAAAGGWCGGSPGTRSGARRSGRPRGRPCRPSPPRSQQAPLLRPSHRQILQPSLQAARPRTALGQPRGQPRLGALRPAQQPWSSGEKGRGDRGTISRVPSTMSSERAFRRANADGDGTPGDAANRRPCFPPANQPLGMGPLSTLAGRSTF